MNSTLLHCLFEFRYFDIIDNFIISIMQYYITNVNKKTMKVWQKMY